MTLSETYPHVPDDILQHYYGVTMTQDDWEYLDRIEAEQSQRAYDEYMRRPSPWFDMAKEILRGRFAEMDKILGISYGKEV